MDHCKYKKKHVKICFMKMYYNCDKMIIYISILCDKFYICNLLHKICTVRNKNII